MHRRHQHQNVPTEIIRTAVAIADLGSFTQAGEKLNLSQAAISAQVKRFEAFVGAPAYERVPGGVRLTERGAFAVVAARRMLEANDQIIRLGGGVSEKQPIRVGLSISYSAAFIPAWRSAPVDEPLILHCDQAANIHKAFAERRVDIACVVGTFGAGREPVVAWEEEVVWVRSRDFVLSPGAPVPLIDWPGSLSNEAGVRALDAAGLAYRFVVTCADFYAITEAVAAGLGVIAVPAPLAVAPMIVAPDYYLPPLPLVRAGIYVREGADTQRMKPIIDLLRVLQKPHRPVAAAPPKAVAAAF